MKILLSTLLAGSMAVIGIPIAAIASDVVLEKSIRSFSVNSDGTFAQTNEVVVRLATEQGAKSAAQVPIPYSESLQSLEVAEAYTIRADGTRVDVSADKIFTQGAPVAVSAPMFSDIKYKIIVFPEPQAGGKLYFRTQLKQKTPHFAGQFSLFEVVPTALPVESFTVRVSAPKDYSLRVFAANMVSVPQSDKDGRKYWEWNLAKPTFGVNEPYAVADSDYAPYVAVSSFQDWGALATAYSNRATSQSRVTPEIKALAEEITIGLSEPTAQAKAIYNWVARNIRYVAVFLELGGFIPRDATEILKTRYGDCKDHTVILEALLRVKDIESTSVLINTMNSFRSPHLPVVGAFNHAINYLPALDVFLDSTAAFQSFDTVPANIEGRHALNVASGRLVKSPMGTSKMNSVINRSQMELRPDGSITGTAEVRASGAFEAQLRAEIATIPASEKDKFVGRWLGNAVKGAGKFQSTNPSDLSEQFLLAATFEIKDSVSLDSPGAFPMPKGFVFVDIANRVAIGSFGDKRGTPFRCASEQILEEVVLTLPDNIKIAALPKNIAHKDKTVAFEVSYKLDGRKIVVSRKLQRDRQLGSCEPSMWAEVGRLSDVIARDARAQVLIQ